jgi:hypothetical protein
MTTIDVSKNLITKSRKNKLAWKHVGGSCGATLDTQSILTFYLVGEKNIFANIELVPVLPDGTFSYQNSQFGYILEGLGVLNVCIFFLFGVFCCHLAHFLVNWNIFARFGTL